MNNKTKEDMKNTIKNLKENLAGYNLDERILILDKVSSDLIEDEFKTGKVQKLSGTAFRELAYVLRDEM